MPYITKDRAAEIGLGDHMRSPGELNYAVTRLGIEYLDDQVCLGRKVNYALIAETISQIEEAADEMRRRILIPYEKAKQQENGDVYPDWLLIAVGAEEPAHPGYNEDKLRHNAIAYTDAKED